MTTATLRDLSVQWVAAKAAESVAQDERRRIEDAMVRVMGMAEDFEGTTSAEAGEYFVKATKRLNRKVDGDKLQDIAAEKGLTEHLSALFRWKPEIDAKAWKQADQSITGALSAAITTTPGRPTIAVTTKEEEKHGISRAVHRFGGTPGEQRL